jgi:hypothetical protein
MKKYIDVQDEGNGASVVRTESGWMRKDAFGIYASYFCSAMMQYRLHELEPALRDKPILLVVDGHLSRLDWLATQIFSLHNIELLVVPGHTSHLLQPFDVAIASPLKTAYQKIIAQERTALEEQFKDRPVPIHHVRDGMCRAFIAAYQQAITPQNAQAGFRKAGLFPLNPDKPKESQYCPDETDETRLYRSQLRPGLANNRLLTSEDELIAITRAETAEERNPVPEIFLLRRGRARRLSRMPPMFLKQGDGTYKEVRFPET